ncbi:phage tail tube protein [Pedobacter cryoconitis]|uniref:TP901-1 family phage major tail protein n=1 Tax=Pedobacter cryoconitis TaxID=188932 RepID=A0A327SJG5_9SPHI|nr:phage tail tube protein [Pedobacter cryoconitis]RAJ28868.1 TP901-1 family phage major tail protein [Pedobacter cryoconitis]
MAEEALGFKNGTKVLLFVKLGTPAAWVTLACLKTNSWDSSTDQIDTTTKCSGRYKTSLPGDISWSFKGDGNAIDDTVAVSQASFNVLAGLQKAGTTFPMKMVGVDDPTDVIRGNVFITSISKSAGRNEAVGFSSTFQGVGEYFLTPEAP